MIDFGDRNNDEMEEFVEETDADMVREEVDEEGLEANAGAKLKQIKERLSKCEKEKQEHLDGWQRERADFLNFKRRTEEERAKDREQAVVRHLSKLLPLLDSFEQAMKSPSWKSGEGTFRSGIEQIHIQLERLLKDYGVETIDPIGTPFDPVEHEAIGDAEGEPDTVVVVVQRGYRIGKTLIRPARVMVGKK